MPLPDDFNPELDLVLDRNIPLTAAQVWKAWTSPALMERWFCPRPWRVEGVVMDLRAGGVFASTICGPEGERFPSAGCFLEVEPGHKMVWTDCLGPGFRPSAQPFMTAMLILDPLPEGCRYIAIARHGSAEAVAQHQQMGFEKGWAAALDQLIELKDEL